MVTLSAGPTYTLETGAVYALPPTVVRIAVQTSGGTITTSVDNVNWQIITLDANDEFVTAAAFIQSANAESLVSIKRE